MNLCNEKTVFALDHSPFFGYSSEEPMEFDLGKGRNMNIVPPSPIYKSLWTCSLEAAIEYCRIVWDLFPEGKLIRVIASDTHGHHFNDWSSQQQNLQHILYTAGTLGPPARAMVQGDYTVIHGLRVAVDVLIQCTDNQFLIGNGALEGCPKIPNNCRVICITSARDNESISRMQDLFHKHLITQNKQAALNEPLLPINFCHLVIINIRPGNESLVTNQSTTDISPILRTEVHSVRASKLSDKLSNLILGHYDLASTTVTGIPMKEEQNASSSANYDVEIFHHANAHTDIFKADVVDPVLVKTRKTMTLKWCTPKANTQELYNCTAAYRVTPVDINSRPSSCLINFLLNGRSVMLEMPKRTGGKSISHLLSAHGGEIFIHALATGRSVLEDPPSLSEGCGGRVTDYRVADFGSFIKSNMLVPLKSRWNEIEKYGRPIQVMSKRLERQTKYWPITISGTLIFNLRQFIDPLPQLIAKEELTFDEVTVCRQIICKLAAQEAKHDPLLVPTAGVRGKVTKREEQYRQMWNELERLVRLHCRTEQHHNVLCTLLELRSKDPDKGEKVELDEALRELDVVTADPTLARASVIRATTDSPMSPPPMQKSSAPLLSSSRQNRLSVNSSIYSGPKSIFDIYMNKVNAENKNIKESRPDFYGRINAGNSIALLYPNLFKEDKDRSNRHDEAMVE